MADVLGKSPDKYGFMFSASSGGCNGFNFDLCLLDAGAHSEVQKRRPQILENGKARLFIDPVTEMYLLGTKIDYIEEDYSNDQYESKFSFTVNKDLASSCGCGISFTPKTNG